MLCKLEVSNYALIENADISFDDGFTAITGETGAGKSILLRSLNLLLGERADTSVIQQSGSKCYLEATFDITNLDLEFFFENAELDYDKACIIRREFNAQGKSRCFVNDTPVQLHVLKELGEKLISVHSQHETLSLFESHFQFELLDSFAGLQKKTQAYSKKFKNYRSLINQLAELKASDAEKRKERDYKTFLLNELIDAKLDDLNLPVLTESFAKIQHAEKIGSALSEVLQLLESETQSPVNSIKRAIHAMESIKSLDPSFHEIYNRLTSAKIELQDLSGEITSQADKLEFSEADASLVKDKIDLFNALTYKHNVKSLEELVALRQQLESELVAMDSTESEIREMELSIEKTSAELFKEATELSKKRKIEAAPLEKTIRAILTNLSMPEAELQIELTPLPEIGTEGLEKIDFLFKTNRGGQFLPLRKIASGGELSRLMLAILSTLSDSKNLPTLIFDEIDSGVSGEVASKIAAEFARMGKKIQVIAITHLPQVAARGKNHLHVSKLRKSDKTTTHIKLLQESERVQELAKMISGEKITSAALENAQNLLNFS